MAESSLVRTYISINYDDYENTNVPMVNDADEPKNLLIADGGREVVFFGEGNFTFSVAFATLRGSWDGITSTHYVDSVRRPEFPKVKQLAIAACKSNGQQIGDPSTTIDHAVKKVKSLSAPPVNAWQYGIDATNIPDTLKVAKKVVWFQCPWTDETDKLTDKFLKHMADKQSRGDYVLIGITKCFPYVKNYKLLNDKGVKDIPNYRFRGADIALVKELLRYGYRHMGRSDIHNEILTDHVTLVFQRK